jgi:hypothetical protein
MMMTDTTKSSKVTLKTLAAAVMAKPEVQREEYLWYYLRQMFPNSSEAALQGWADKVHAWVTL